MDIIRVNKDRKYRILSIDSFIVLLFVLLGTFISKNIIYILFFYFIFFQNGRLIRNSLNRIVCLGAFYSIILPDNYIPILLFTALFFLIMIKQHKMISKSLGINSIIIFLMIIFVIISAVINQTPVINLVFSIISFAPFVYFVILSNAANKIDLRINRIHFDRLFVVEMIATAFNFVTYISSHNPNWDGWSCGTFSSADQAQFFVIIGFLFFVYYDLSKKNKDRKDLKYCMICLVIMISTFNWFLVSVFLVGFVGYTLVEGWNKRRRSVRDFKRKAGVITLTILMVAVLIYLAPAFVKTVIPRLLSDSDYFSYRFYKAIAYKITFVDIPKGDIIFLLFGSGIGYYCSRAALICTGAYIAFYSKFFSPSISKYTQQYFYYNIVMAYQNPTTDYGSVMARPYSSIMALMGEGGIILLILFFAWLYNVLKNHKYLLPVTIFWLAVSCVENYFEYPKVMLLLTICYCFIAYKRQHKTE